MAALRLPSAATGYTAAVADGTLPLTVQESPGRVRLCLGSLAHGDGPTLQDAADDLVQRLLTYAMAFRASGLRPSLEMTPPDLAAMDLLYQGAGPPPPGAAPGAPAAGPRGGTRGGPPVLSLLPPRGIGISVLVTSTAPPDLGAPNLSTSGCRPVRVGGVEGSWCQDTTSMVVSTTLAGSGTVVCLDDLATTAPPLRPAPTTGC